MPCMSLQLMPGISCPEGAFGAGLGSAGNAVWACAAAGMAIVIAIAVKIVVMSYLS